LRNSGAAPVADANIFICAVQLHHLACRRVENVVILWKSVLAFSMIGVFSTFEQSLISVRRKKNFVKCANVKFFPDGQISADCRSGDKTPNESKRWISEITNIFAKMPVKSNNALGLHICKSSTESAAGAAPEFRNPLINQGNLYHRKAVRFSILT